MKRRSRTMIWTVAAFSLASCSSNSTDTSQVKTQPLPSPPQSFPQPIVPATAPTTNLTTGKAGRATVVKGLVPATDPGKHRVPLTTGRRDPFAAANLPEFIPYSRPANSTAAVALPQETMGSPIALVPLPPPANSLGNPTLPALAPLPTVGVAPANAPAMATAPTAMPVPTSPTSLAMSVQVSGIGQIGDKLSAIVTVPEEGTSRYVRVGDYLANGRVLVKRIQVKGNSEPLVVLEQNGIEVIKYAGGSLMSFR